jgi:hypothetical protein
MAGYTAVYNSGDAGTSIIDWIVSIVVGLVQQGNNTGQALGITIVIGLYLGLMYLLFQALKSLLDKAKGMGKNR